MTYSRYLALDMVFDAQRPVSSVEDERLFITVHQIRELWLARINAELWRAKALVRDGDLHPADAVLARILPLLAAMTAGWDVLATMAPADHARLGALFGDDPDPLSDQFRTFEYLLGMKRDAPPPPDSTDGAGSSAAAMTDAFDSPSLWDDAVAQLAVHRFDVPINLLERDWRLPYRPDPMVEAGWRAVYADTDRWRDLHRLAERLLDIDDALAILRYRRDMALARLTGRAIGIGGHGAARAFPELWSLRAGLPSMKDG